MYCSAAMTGHTLKQRGCVCTAKSQSRSLACPADLPLPPGRLRFQNHEGVPLQVQQRPPLLSHQGREILRLPAKLHGKFSDTQYALSDKNCAIFSWTEAVRLYRICCMHPQPPTSPAFSHPSNSQGSLTATQALLSYTPPPASWFPVLL